MVENQKSVECGGDAASRRDFIFIRNVVFGMNATDQFMLAVTLLIFALLVVGLLLALV
ncbi:MULTISPECIES: hypothetical protein [unclassified Haloferax]|uniref:hypothetical protein n=1 Tax=unclassified Haloferax TaxID=2625095 RepID=UPI000AEF906A|nr:MULTISPECIES: hypothetical protein [unclassified Haloferax]